MKYTIHILILVTFVGCADEGFLSADSSGVNNTTQSTKEERLAEAQRALDRNDLAAANGIYAAELRQSPADGDAAAGLAITDLLLFPYHPTVTAVITDNLGGSGALNQNRDIIYGDQGILFFLAKGVPWEDDGMFAGLRSVIEPDLPWQGDVLDSPETFVDSLDKSVNVLMGNLVRVAHALEPIQNNIEIALDDPEYRATFIPGQVFHHDTLTLNISKPDLALLNAGLSSVRATIYFLAAYQYEFSLAEAFGTQWANIDPADERFVEGYDTGDYVTEFLDQKLFRQIRNGENLNSAGNAVRSMLQSVRRALNLSQETETVGTLMWGEADSATVDVTLTFLEAIENSVNGSTTLPGIEPALALDLSPLFTDGRVLSEEIRWMERVEVTDDLGTYFQWQLTQEAYDAFFSDLFVPPLDGEEFQWTDGDDVGELVEMVFNPFANDVEDVYLQTL